MDTEFPPPEDSRCEVEEGGAGVEAFIFARSRPVFGMPIGANQYDEQGDDEPEGLRDAGE